MVKESKRAKNNKNDKGDINMGKIINFYFNQEI